MIDIALLGFGIIGGGVAKVLETNGDIIAERLGTAVRIKYILDLRDFPDSPYADRVVHSFDPILSDPDVSIVVEAMGGVHPAADYTEAALNAGKSVVSSNKAVVAECGDRLLALARRRGVRYLFEAAVGGGIPVIRTMVDDLASNRIESVRGILNGTTNYILTRMETEDCSYAEALAEAQRLGYAERDPGADVEGLDSARKIIILAAIAYGKLIPLESVSVRGITSVGPGDIKQAAAEGCRIKLIAEARLDGEGRIYASVAPRKVPASSLLYSVNGVYNAVSVTGNMLGEAVLYGQGAGRDATAGAVVADVIDAAERKFASPSRLRWVRASDADVSAEK